MQWFQNSIRLPSFRRGFHLITEKIEEAIPEIKNIKIGLTCVYSSHFC